VLLRLQDGTEELGKLDHLRLFKGQPQVQWSKQLILAEERGPDSSQSLVLVETFEVDSSFQPHYEMSKP